MTITDQAGAQTDAGGPVGAQLAARRKELGLSVDDICERTNIRPVVVVALERGDIGPSGGAVYARGHVRSLASALELDPEPLLAAFNASYIVETPPVLARDRDAVGASLRPTSAPMRGPRWPLAAAGVLIVVIALALAQLLVPGSKNALDSAARHGATTGGSATSPPAKKHPRAVPPPLVFPVPASGLTLRIELLAKPSWLDVKDERGVQLIQRVASASARAIDLHAAGLLYVTIGDASAASVSCNGHPLGTLGGSHQVVSFTLSRGSLQCPAS